ncbi:hypothetical protein L6452_40343 [Arctium lappa]|uniref:Uncharacterized protein n=1 Tax=Arctium lappa TaxID=4217 RepID=A0ACB8XLW5_ARCLA|nr:hypothetical protein L6452_40343 [Arctium lappa]
MGSNKKLSFTNNSNKKLPLLVEHNSSKKLPWPTTEKRETMASEKRETIVGSRLHGRRYIGDGDERQQIDEVWRRRHRSKRIRC